MTSESAERWHGRRLLATLLDVSIFLTPVAAASLALWALAGHLGAYSTIWRVLILLGAASLAAVGAERLVRRIVPLSALLRLTMLFPIGLRPGSQSRGRRAIPVN